MANRLVVDTDALIGLLRGDETWLETLRDCEKLMALQTTDINVFELYYGAYKSAHQARNLAATKGMLNKVGLLHSDEDSIEVAARIAVDLQADGQPLDLKDLLIGSIALVHGLPVLTGNDRHLSRIDGLEVWAKKRPENAE